MRRLGVFGALLVAGVAASNSGRSAVGLSFINAPGLASPELLRSLARTGLRTPAPAAVDVDAADVVVWIVTLPARLLARLGAVIGRVLPERLPAWWQPPEAGGGHAGTLAILCSNVFYLQFATKQFRNGRPLLGCLLVAAMGASMFYHGFQIFAGAASCLTHRAMLIDTAIAVSSGAVFVAKCGLPRPHLSAMAASLFFLAPSCGPLYAASHSAWCVSTSPPIPYSRCQGGRLTDGCPGRRLGARALRRHFVSALTAHDMAEKAAVRRLGAAGVRQFHKSSALVSAVFRPGLGAHAQCPVQRQNATLLARTYLASGRHSAGGERGVARSILSSGAGPAAAAVPAKVLGQLHRLATSMQRKAARAKASPPSPGTRRRSQPEQSSSSDARTRQAGPSGALGLLLASVGERIASLDVGTLVGDLRRRWRASIVLPVARLVVVAKTMRGGPGVGRGLLQTRSHAVADLR